MPDSDSNASSSSPATAPNPHPNPALDPASDSPGSPATQSSASSTLAPAPIAWQPLTFGGVAAFATATLGRLLFVQSIVALLVAAAAGWFLSVHWFPTVRKAIRHLPDTGEIRGGQLVTPRASAEPLVETRYLSVAVDATDSGVASALADLRVEFHRNHWGICGFAGCVTRRYPVAETIPFNRPEFEAWWGAWQPMLFALITIGMVVALFGSWLALATLGFVFPWLTAYFKDRQLSALGAWKLAAAALLPGALLVAVGIVLYGLGVVNLLQFLCIWIAHGVVGCLYLASAPFRLPRVAGKPVRDPFGTAAAPARRKNPFMGKR